jgi:hypothetical protein
MYNQRRPNKASFRVNKSTEGETIEAKMRRIMQNKEPITDGAPLLFQERNDGIDPATNIRTDRFELAANAMGKVTKDTIAKRKGGPKTQEQPKASKDTKGTTGTGGDANKE